jgi:hypothetical protein
MAKKKKGPEVTPESVWSDEAIERIVPKDEPEEPIPTAEQIINGLVPDDTTQVVKAAKSVHDMTSAERVAKQQERLGITPDPEKERKHRKTLAKSVGETLEELLKDGKKKPGEREIKPNPRDNF